jgi:hypothetical protein
MRPYLEKTNHKHRAGGVAQVKTLSLNPSTTKKKEKNYWFHHKMNAVISRIIIYEFRYFPSKSWAGSVF